MSSLIKKLVQIHDTAIRRSIGTVDDRRLSRHLPLLPRHRSSCSRGLGAILNQASVRIGLDSTRSTPAVVSIESVVFIGMTSGGCLVAATTVTMLLLQVSRIASFPSSIAAPRNQLFLTGPLRTVTSLATSFTHSTKYTKTLFDLQLPEGRCIGLQLAEDETEMALEGWSNASHWIHECLHPDEVKYGQQQTAAVRKSFLLGRMALRLASGNNQPCLKDRHGRPTLPQSHMGSISHKGNLGVALIAPSCPRTSIGVDIELCESKRRSIAPKVLTEREIRSLGQLEGLSMEEEVLLRFSLKEAIYKAAHPLINQYVSFQEAEVTPVDDGTATCVWNLKSGAHTKLATATAHWRKVDKYFLSSACCTLLPLDEDAK
jgi:phosphopantetheine--protein transferase-like protein